MFAIIGSIAFCCVIGFALSWLSGFFRTLGLGVITDFMHRMIFYDRETSFNDNVIWNKDWIRWGVLVGVIVYVAAAIAGMMATGIGLVFGFSLETFFTLYKYTAIGMVLCYIYFIYKRKPAGEFDLKKAKGQKNEPSFTFLTNRGKIILKNIARGIFISGGAGSGKTKSFIIPVIQQSAEQNLTGLLYDYKFPTLAKEVYGSYKDSKVKTYFVNFTDLDRTNRVNPISPKVITNSAFAREASSTLFKNLEPGMSRDFFLQSAEVLLLGTIWYLKRNWPQFCTLPHAVSLILEAEKKTLVEKLQEDEEVNGLIASIKSSFDSEKQLAGIFSSAQNYLSIFNTPEIFWVLSGDEVNLDLNKKDQPSMLVIGNDPTLPNTIPPLVALIVSTTIKRLNQPGREKSVIVLDEAPTLIIPNYQNIPATGRENGISNVYVVQDITQMEGMLGDKETKMIVSNLGTQFYLRTTNDQTAQKVSNMFGKRDVEYVSYSTGESSNSIFKPKTYNSGQSTSVQQRDRIEPQKVMRFQPGECAAIIAEGNTDEFIGQFKQVQSKAEDIPAFKNVSEQDTTLNFRKIKSEIREIITSVIALQIPDVQKIEAPNFEVPKVKISKPSNQENTLDDFA